MPFLQNMKSEDLTLCFYKADKKNYEELCLEEDDAFQRYLKICIPIPQSTMKKPFADWSLKNIVAVLIFYIA